MSLQYSWQDALGHDTRRQRRIVRGSKLQSAAKIERKTKLALVRPSKVEVRPVVPGDYLSAHSVTIPTAKRWELPLAIAAAIGVHVFAAWTLTHLPAGELIASPQPAPIEVAFVTPPPPPPPPQVEPPKVVQKVVKAPQVPVVQKVIAQDIAPIDNVVAVQEGPPPAPAPAVEEKVTAARADANYLNNPAPEYPPVALRQGWQGTVQLRVLVQPDGRPGTITLEKSSGKKVLDDAALVAVQKWKFVPAKRGDQPIEGWVSFPIEFSLES
ncbi:MAG TPA: TonB family protein [Spongiibacteraceae bacterium]